MTELRTSEVLNLAADLIERDGWAIGPEGMYVTGPHCVQGAVQAAMNAKTWHDPRGEEKFQYFDTAPCAAGDAVKDYLGVLSTDGIWMWNDEQKDAANVVEVLRATAIIEAAKEDDAIAAEFLTWQGSEISA